MRRFGRGVAVSVGAGLLAVGSAAGFGGWQRPLTVYSYPAPAYFAPSPIATALPFPASQPLPAWIACPSTPAVSIAPAPYARPTPAPPSAGATPSTQEPPLAPPAPNVPKLPAGKPVGPSPAVSESRSYFDVYDIKPEGPEKPAGDRCSVGFWNAAEGDLTLKVNGQSYTLLRAKSLTLELGRAFVWQLEGREANPEKVSADKLGLEIVIRR